MCYFNTQKCAKLMSPVSTHCTCAKLKDVLNEHVLFLKCAKLTHVLLQKCANLAHARSALMLVHAT